MLLDRISAKSSYRVEVPGAPHVWPGCPIACPELVEGSRLFYKCHDIWTNPQEEMAPVYRSHEITVVYGTLSNLSIGLAEREVKLLEEIISVFSPHENSSTETEYGPGGTRTRIYDLDRVSCCRYTTGPEWSIGVTG